MVAKIIQNYFNCTNVLKKYNIKMIKNINVLLSAVSVFVLLVLGSCRYDKEIPQKPTEKKETGSVVCDGKCREDKQEEENEKKKKEDEEKKKTEEEQTKVEEEKRKDEERKQKEKEEDEKRKRDEVAKKGKPFIAMLWVSDDNKIYIPLNEQYLDKYNYTVMWKNIDKPNLKGEAHVGNDRNINKGIINVPETGDYRVEIKGDFPAIYYNNREGNGDGAQNLIRIEQWGGIEWETMNKAFAGCKNLQITAKDAPDLSRVRDMSYMFEAAWHINQPINHWDVSNVAFMKGMFKNAANFNQPLDKWNVSNVTDMKEMFYNAVSFNQSLNNWNVSNVKYKDNMFLGAKTFDKKNISSWK